MHPLNGTPFAIDDLTEVGALKISEYISEIVDSPEHDLASWRVISPYRWMLAPNAPADICRHLIKSIQSSEAVNEIDAKKLDSTLSLLQDWMADQR